MKNIFFTSLFWRKKKKKFTYHINEHRATKKDMLVLYMHLLRETEKFREVRLLLTASKISFVYRSISYIRVSFVYSYRRYPASRTVDLSVASFDVSPSRSRKTPPRLKTRIHGHQVQRHDPVSSHEESGRVRYKASS